jgi:hypothetical protein
MDENDPKAENLLMMIWRGKEAARSDGDIFGYSHFTHIILTHAKKTKNASLMQLVTNHFDPNYNVNYGFQYRFRLKSINFYFFKEIFCALLMLIIFQYINYRYLVLFSKEFIYSEAEDETSNASLLESVHNSVREYADWNFSIVFFSSSLLFQLFLKLCFNMFSS